MKVYKFFLIPDNDYEYASKKAIEERYVLYALTNSKKLAKRFQDERNMDKFIIRVHEDIDKSEYAEMCNEDRGAVLELRTLSTVLDNNHTRSNIEQVEILMTYYERQLIEEPMTLFDDESIWNTMPYPRIFKSKYRKMLDAFQYTTYYKIMNMGSIPFPLMEKLTGKDDDYAGPAIEYDEVALFIDQIRSTL